MRSTSRVFVSLQSSVLFFTIYASSNQGFCASRAKCIRLKKIYDLTKKEKKYFSSHLSQKYDEDLKSKTKNNVWAKSTMLLRKRWSWKLYRLEIRTFVCKDYVVLVSTELILYDESAKRNESERYSIFNENDKKFV